MTAGIKVGSGRKSADGTENELDTIMTPLLVNNFFAGNVPFAVNNVFSQ